MSSATSTSRGGVIGLAAVWLVCTALAAFCPWAPLRIAALVVFLIALPLAAAYVAQRRVFGTSTMLDLRVGATAATALLLLLAVGSLFFGFGIPLHRWALVLALGVLSAAVVVADKFLAGPPSEAVDAIDRDDASADGEDDGTTAASHRSGTALLAYGVAGVCVVAAIVVTVVSQRTFDHRDAFTALGIHQTANRAGVRSYELTVDSHDTRDRSFVLRIEVTGRPTAVLDLPVASGASVTRQVSAPATASVSAVLALRDSPTVPYRRVHIGH